MGPLCSSSQTSWGLTHCHFCHIRAAKGGAVSETKPRLDHPTQPGLPRTDLILELGALLPGVCPSWHPGTAGHPESSLEVSLLSPGVGPSVGTALELGILATHFSGHETQEQALLAENG